MVENSRGIEGPLYPETILDISSSFILTVITLLSDVSIIACAYAFTNPFRYGFRPYVKACITSSMARSGSTTTMLSN